MSVLIVGTIRWYVDLLCLSIKSRKGEMVGGMRCSSKMVGRGRREPVGGEDGVNICCSL